MATLKPRVNVTLEPHRYDLLKRLAGLQGVSMSYLIADLLETVAEPLERVCVVLEAASKAPDNVKDGLRAALYRAERVLLPQADEFMEQADLFFTDAAARIEAAGAGDSAASAADAAGDGTGRDPRPVTRGSTPPTSPTRRKAKTSPKALSRKASGQKKFRGEITDEGDGFQVALYSGELQVGGALFPDDGTGHAFEDARQMVEDWEARE